MSFVLVVRMTAKEGNEDEAVATLRGARRGDARRDGMRGCTSRAGIRRTRARSSSTSSTGDKAAFEAHGATRALPAARPPASSFQLMDRRASAPSTRRL